MAKEESKPTKRSEALAAEEDTRRKGQSKKVATLARKLSVGQVDPEVELKKRQVREEQRAKNRKAKAEREAKMTPAEKRKELLESRLNNPNSQYPIEQRRQFKAELHAIKIGVWFEPKRDADGTTRPWKVPRQPTNYDRHMAS